MDGALGARPGGSRSLVAVLRLHGDALEADCQRYYRIDLWRDLVTGRLSLRRLWVLATHLPTDSATHTALRDGKPDWSLEAHLLDDVRMALVGSKEKPAKPHPLRPKAPPKQMTAERRSAIERGRERRRARHRRMRKEG